VFCCCSGLCEQNESSRQTPGAKGWLSVSIRITWQASSCSYSGPSGRLHRGKALQKRDTILRRGENVDFCLSVTAFLLSGTGEHGRMFSKIPGYQKTQKKHCFPMSAAHRARMLKEWKRLLPTSPELCYNPGSHMLLWHTFLSVFHGFFACLTLHDSRGGF